jgi:hypothetical protein
MARKRLSWDSPEVIGVVLPLAALGVVGIGGAVYTVSTWFSRAMESASERSARLYAEALTAAADARAWKVISSFGGRWQITGILLLLITALALWRYGVEVKKRWPKRRLNMLCATAIMLGMGAVALAAEIISRLPHGMSTYTQVKWTAFTCILGAVIFVLPYQLKRRRREMISGVAVMLFILVLVLIPMCK